MDTVTTTARESLASVCEDVRDGVVSPYIVGSLMSSYQLPGVIWLMIGLVLVQILVVWLWGVEPRNRGLEDVAQAAT